MNPLISIVVALARNGVIGTETGLARLEGGRLSWLRRQDGLTHDDVNALYEDRGGALWIGTMLMAGHLIGTSEVVQKNFKLVILGIVFVSVLPMVIEVMKGQLRSRKSGQAFFAPCSVTD